MRWLFAGILLLAVPAQAAWTQPGGDASHSGAADWGALDVQRAFRLTPETHNLTSDGQAPGLVVETPHGLLALGRERGTTTSQCQLFTVELDGSAPPAPAQGGPDPFACTDASRLLGYDPVNDLALYSRIPGPGEGPVAVVAWNLTRGSQQFAFAPSGLQGSVDQVPSWSTSLAALDVPGRSLYLALAPVPNGVVPDSLEADDFQVRLVEGAGNDNELVKLGLPDGQVLWRSGEGDYFGWPSFTKLTAGDLGVVVEGSCNQGYCFAWFDLEGNFREAAQSFRDAGTQNSLDNPGTSDNEREAINEVTLEPAHSLHAAGDGTRMVMVHAGSLVTVYPDRVRAEIRELAQPVPAGHILAAPAIRGDTIAAPLQISIAFVDGRAESPRIWPGDHSSYVQQVLLGERQAAVLMARGSDVPGLEGGASLFLVDLSTVRTTQRLELALPVPYLGSFNDRHAFLTPLADGRLLAWTRTYEAILLGPPLHGQPRVTVLDPYASLGAGIDLEWTGAGIRSVVSWGDGTETVVLGAGGRAGHTYIERGPFNIHVTDTFDDGSTATSTIVVHPGEDAPQTLTWAQTQFEPENQERTYFILGLAFTLAGALIAILQRRRHRSLIQADLVVLDALEKQAKTDPLEAKRDLADYERLLRERLAKGKMRDADYGILDRRVRDIAAQLDRPARPRAKAAS